MMEWYDKYFLTFLLIGIASAIIVPAAVYPYSPFASAVGFVFSAALTIGMRMDWIDFRKRHGRTHETQKRCE